MQIRTQPRAKMMAEFYVEGDHTEKETINAWKSLRKKVPLR